MVLLLLPPPHETRNKIISYIEKVTELQSFIFLFSRIEKVIFNVGFLKFIHSYCGLVL
jgi:hypothetical protein